MYFFGETLALYAANVMLTNQSPSTPQSSKLLVDKPAYPVDDLTYTVDDPTYTVSRRFQPLSSKRLGAELLTFPDAIGGPTPLAVDIADCFKQS